MAEGTAAPPRDFTRVFAGSLAYCAEKLTLGGDPSGHIAAADLLQEGVLEEMVDRFGASYAGGDRRAIVSLWSQWYFGTLLVPTTAVLLRSRRLLPLRLEEVGVSIEPELHHAVAVRLPGAGPVVPDASPFQRFHDLVWHHLAPLVEAVSARFGVSERLLWSSAGGYVEWTIRQLETCADDEAAVDGHLLVTTLCWPDGRRNPLFQPVRYVCEGEAWVRRRRVCCLRYLLPGNEGCGDLCPLPKIRAAD